MVYEHERASPKVNVWCCVTVGGVIGPYFFNEPTVNSVNYLDMLESYAMDEIPLNICRTGYFQQDGAPAHYANIVRHFLDGELSKLNPNSVKRKTTLLLFNFDQVRFI